MSTREELVSKVDDAVRLDDVRDIRKLLFSYEKEANEKEFHFSQGQVSSLIDAGLHLYGAGHGNLIYPILDMILKRSDYEVKTTMEFPHPLSDDLHEIRRRCLIVDIMKYGHIVSSDEVALYYDDVWAYFEDSQSYRAGGIILTPDRMLLEGSYVFSDIGRATSIRIYYDDWESRPYLASVDFLDYKNIKSIQPVWKFTAKEIKIVYHTKYVRQKSQILYGPYFFKFNLGKSTDIREGDLNIRIVPPPYADGKKERHQATAEKLLELSGFGT
jgi:hypothetical protein